MRRKNENCRIFTLMLLLLSIFVLASCSSGSNLQGEGKVLVVDMIVKRDWGDYWNTIKMGAEVAAKEYNVKLNFIAPENEMDFKGQIALMEQSIERRPDVIILSASNYEALGQVTDRTSYYNIPVISMDSEVASAKVKTYVGTNNYEAGQKAAERLVQLTNEQGDIGIINYVLGARNADQREEGFLDYIARFPEIKVVDIKYCGSDEWVAYTQTKEMLSNYPRLDGIVALNAESSIGAGRAVKEMGFGGKIKMITFDNPPEMLELLQEQTVQAMVVQNPFNNGYLAVRAAVEAANGEKLEDKIPTDTKLIDLDNMLWPENQKLLFPFVK
ncbi:ribose transport system substrate-binding protein [Fontibacillus panacisegetis]|uniref:Ribose transport system substrate-binding protein n=1 Tax=Fontibacillus panacisegetis TaxID=670482 RepID=A0A1G7KVU6_9BACL|nr:substrate-binding domain-containing protein [Fontibacillus panacisegetis]SDF41040.1 ribose transport system substrate-binding protein [Fontibacillus panacisegetis]